MKQNPRPESILRLITDLIFVATAVYLVLNYLRIMTLSAGSPIDMFREAFFLIFLLMALALLATRGGIRDFTGRKIDFVYTIVGFSALLFFQPTAGVEPNVVGVSLELIGLGLVASGFVSLNRSFGLAPENRGVKTGGAYRFVRHPMYLGYILSEGGFCFDNLPYLNLIILTISVTFLVLRLLAEERLLQRDQGYRSYAEKTRWKLVPYVF